MDVSGPPDCGSTLRRRCHSQYGFVSTLGIMLWVTIAANALFLTIFSLATRCGGAVFWLAVSAFFLNGWLALDDAFLLHETVLPAFGVPQNTVLAAYASLAVIYLVTNLRPLLKGDVWLLIIGGLALVASLAVDTLFHSLDPRLVLLEDSAKFFGLFCWTAFHVSLFLKIAVTETQTRGQATQ